MGFLTEHNRTPTSLTNNESKQQNLHEKPSPLVKHHGSKLKNENCHKTGTTTFIFSTHWMDNVQELYLISFLKNEIRSNSVSKFLNKLYFL